MRIIKKGTIKPKEKKTKRLVTATLDAIGRACPFLCAFLFVLSFTYPQWWAKILVQLLAFASFVWYRYITYASPTVYHVCFLAKRKDNGESGYCSAEYRIRYAEPEGLVRYIESHLLLDHPEFDNIIIISLTKLSD